MTSQSSRVHQVWDGAGGAPPRSPRSPPPTLVHIPLGCLDFPRPPPPEGNRPQASRVPGPRAWGRQKVGGPVQKGSRGDEVALPRGQGRQRPGRVHDDTGASLTTSAPAGKAVGTWRDWAEMVLPWPPPFVPLPRPRGFTGTCPLRHGGVGCAPGSASGKAN